MSTFYTSVGIGEIGTQAHGLVVFVHSRFFSPMDWYRTMDWTIPPPV